MLARLWRGLTVTALIKVSSSSFLSGVQPQMKRCPSCNRTYTDVSLNFCLEDGTPLINEAAASLHPNATVRYSPGRDTGDPPPTEIYQPAPLLNQVHEMVQPRQWAPGTMPPQKKSNAIWWLLGVVVVVGIIGVGLVVMIIAIASLSGDTNTNANTADNTNVRVVNRNGNDNSNTSGSNRSNSNSANLPASFTDDFSEQSWGTGNSRFGDIWYADGEYHMKSKEKTYLVMYGPNNDYNTEDATVRVTARSVDGYASTSGYGLLVHGEKAKGSQLEDYGLLIYTGESPQYQIVSHKDGNQSALVPWTKSSIIRSGTSPNQLEARIKGDQISFYVNGQYINRITDNQNFRRGLVGLYTSDTFEVAFDDIEIRR